MAKVLALTARPIRFDAEDVVRTALVLACALALICARQPLPFL